MVYYVREELLADDLFAKVVGRTIGGALDEWLAEHLAALEKVVHPLAPGLVLHDTFGIGDAV